MEIKEGIILKDLKGIHVDFKRYTGSFPVIKPKKPLTAKEIGEILKPIKKKI